MESSGENGDAFYVPPTTYVAHSYANSFSRPTSSSRLFHVYHTSFASSNLTVTSDDKRHLFYVKNSSFWPGKPNVTLHAGPDKNAPIAAACKFRCFSDDSKIALGDPNSVNGVVWEDLTKTSFFSSKYRWDMTIYPGNAPRDTRGHRGERRTFFWKRTRSIGIGDWVPSVLGSCNWKLVDGRTGGILAVYAHNNLKSFRKSGKFQINVDYGRDFDTMVLITGLALLEKQRRKSHGGADGGGG